MLKRLYVHNYRCLENFEVQFKDLPSSMLVGLNGTGKTTVGLVIDLFAKVCRGQNQVGELVSSKDFFLDRLGSPMRFEIEVEILGQNYDYVLAFELPDGFRELRVYEEILRVDGSVVFSRREAKVTMPKSGQHEANFLIDWHQVALPIIQEYSQKDPLFVFKSWLKKIVVLSPVPMLIDGVANEASLQPKRDGSNFANWLSGVLDRYPAAYTDILDFLKNVMPDILDFQFDHIGEDSKVIKVRFKAGSEIWTARFSRLSDGEKTFFLIGLRRGFDGAGQIIVTSHNQEAIKAFSIENIFQLKRNSHLEPSVCRLLADVDIDGNLIEALIDGDL